jgi:hypothetical protein
MIYSELISNLWIGDVEIANKVNFLKDNNIDIIINCTNSCLQVNNISIITLDLPDTFELACLTINSSKDKLMKFIYDNIDTSSILIVSWGNIRISSYIAYLFIETYGKISKQTIKNMIQIKNSLISLDY